jgi:uncharacterized small protein (TIGR04563 family)
MPALLFSRVGRRAPMYASLRATRTARGRPTPASFTNGGVASRKGDAFLDPTGAPSYKVLEKPTDGAVMPGTDKRKQSLYFPEDMLNEIQAEANRQDRSLSWIVQQAWRIARGEIMRFPSVNDVLSGVAREDEREEKGG